MFETVNGPFKRLKQRQSMKTPNFVINGNKLTFQDPVKTEESDQPVKNSSFEIESATSSPLLNFSKGKKESFREGDSR